MNALATEDEMEDADFCGFCEATHWPSDEEEGNSTWQQWQCQECGAWNDKDEETPPRKTVPEPPPVKPKKEDPNDGAWGRLIGDPRGGLIYD